MSASDIFKFQSRWTTYTGSLHINTLVGGIPKDGATIHAFVKARITDNASEMSRIAEETMVEMGLDPVLDKDELSAAQVDEIVDKVSKKAVAGNGFKQINGELVWEGRCLKAALNEACNALYPGVESFPGKPDKTKKGLKSYFIERVEVVDYYIPLGRTEPDIKGEERIKHISDPQGKRSAINLVDVCTDLDITFTIKVLNDWVPQELWQELFEYVELGGVWADRARGDGRCELTSWEKSTDSRSVTRSNGKRRLATTAS